MPNALPARPTRGKRNPAAPTTKRRAYNDASAATFPAPAGVLPARFVFALSGGVDSVTLLHALAHAGFRPLAAHFNHRWRPAEDETARFCRRLARALGLDFSAGRARASTPKTEEAAREERYAFLARTARQHRLDALVTAHTASDQAETFLMRLIRGAGPRGLAGMRPASERDGLRILRPWLHVSRSEILAAARRARLQWIEDPVNRDTTRLRAAVRHKLLPLLIRLGGPGLPERILRAAGILAEDEAWAEACAAAALPQLRDRSRPARLVARALAGLPPALARRAVRLWIRNETGLDPDFSETAAVLGLLAAGAPAAANLRRNLRVRRTAARLWIDPPPRPLTKPAGRPVRGREKSGPRRVPARSTPPRAASRPASPGRRRRGR